MTAGEAASRAARDQAAVAALADLVAVMDRLRSPGGCPWDAEQTHASLVPYAVEEVFEVVEAVESGDRTALREELGDLLLQVVFHARVAAEHATEPFDIGDVATGIADKLRRRHPHVFADAAVRDADEVATRWDEIKRAEKERTSALDGVPAGLPALARAQTLLARASRAGLDVGAALHAVAEPATATPLAGAEQEGEGEGVAPETDAAERRLGADLLAAVVRAERDGLDAERALRGAVRRLEGRLRAHERDGRVGAP